MSSQPALNETKIGQIHVNDLTIYHDELFISASYRAMLGRDPDEIGMRYYLQRLRDGVSKIEIIGDIKYSTEGRAAGIRIVGLLPPYAIERIGRWPWIGGIFRFFVALCELPRMRRRQLVLENRILQFAARADHRAAKTLAAVNDALREIENLTNQVVEHAATRVTQEDFLELWSSVKSAKQAIEELRIEVSTKAGLKDLQEVRRLTASTLETKFDKVKGSRG